MRIGTTTIEDIAIDDSVAEIKEGDFGSARVFIQTLISQFSDKYTIEDPSAVKKAVRPVARALHGLQKKGFDMKHYADQVVSLAVYEFEKYSGSKDTFAHVSTLTVIDAITHKRETGYWKREKSKFSGF